MSQRFKIVLRLKPGSTDTPEVLKDFEAILADMVDRGIMPRKGEYVSSEWHNKIFLIKEVFYVYHTEHGKQLDSPKILFYI